MEKSRSNNQTYGFSLWTGVAGILSLWYCASYFLCGTYTDFTPFNPAVPLYERDYPVFPMNFIYAPAGFVEARLRNAIVMLGVTGQGETHEITIDGRWK